MTVDLFCSGIVNKFTKNFSKNPPYSLEYRQCLNEIIKVKYQLNPGLTLIKSAKDLSFCHKLKFSKPNIPATGCCKPLIFQT